MMSLPLSDMTWIHKFRKLWKIKYSTRQWINFLEAYSDINPQLENFTWKIAVKKSTEMQKDPTGKFDNGATSIQGSECKNNCMYWLLTQFLRSWSSLQRTSIYYIQRSTCIMLLSQWICFFSLRTALKSQQMVHRYMLSSVSVSEKRKLQFLYNMSSYTLRKFVGTFL